MDESPTFKYLVAALPVAAMFLHFGLTEWGTQHVTVYCDHSNITRGPAGSALFVMYYSVADMMPVRNQACGVEALDSVTGIFTRWSLPPIIALLGGILTPGLLLLGFLATASRRSWRLPVALACAAAFTAIVFTKFDGVWAEYRTDNGQQYLYGPYVQRRIEPPLVALGNDREHCKGCREFLIWGIFPRENVPAALGLWGGIVAPTCLLMLGLGVGVQQLRFRKRPA
ncbi:MAG TPA: hypothetical protein VGG10_00490 [Rhizomicrobium sp.]|jgi:hypothetical protein